MIKLSAAIICFNEQKRIAQTLESLQGVADEVVVIDSYSTDDTAEICKSFNVKFIQNPFEGHIEQKNFALDQCSNDYIISLDGDEVLSDQLRESILKVKENWNSDGYSFNRLTHYVDMWVHNCGWYPDTKLRLVKKSSARWSGVNPHDYLELDKGMKSLLLKGDLLHYSYDTVSDHISQTNKFTTIAAKAAFQNGAKSGIIKIITRPFFKFIRDYFLKRGFLDGKYGLIICYINSLYTFLKYTKIRELELGREI